MAIPVHLQQFTAAGIYRVVFDKSTIDGFPASTLRLVVGYSEKGLFNTPVLIKSATEFVKTFGNISKKLEKRGVFFHRMALQALGAGPIIALNLKRLADGDLYAEYKDNAPGHDEHGTGNNISTHFDRTDVEAVSAISFNVANGADSIDDFSEIGIVRLEDIYDTTRFWNLSPTQLNANTEIFYGSNTVNKMDGYVNIVSTDTKETSNTIFMRKSQIKGYDVTVKDWYSGIESERPEWLTDDAALMSDYMAEIYVFRGKFEPSVVQDPNFTKFFKVVEDEEGKRSLQVVPYVVNAFGEVKDTLDELAKVPQANFIAKYTGSLIPYLKDKTNRYIALDLLFNADNYAHNMMMNLNTDLTDEDGFTIDLNKFSALNEEHLGEINSAAGKILAYIEAEMNDEDTEEMEYDAAVSFEKPVPALSIKAVAPAILVGKWDADSESYVYGPSEIAYAGTAPLVYIDGWKTTADIDGTKIKIVDYEDTGADDYTAWTALGVKLGDRFVGVPYDDADKAAEVGLAAGDGRAVYVESMAENDEGDFIITFSGPVYNNNGALIRLQGSLANQFGVLEPSYIEGYTYHDPRPTKVNEKGEVVPSVDMWAKLQWQNRLLSAISDYKGLRIGLTSKTEIEYRYIVDTFDSYIDSEIKAVLSKLASEKENALAILNFPSMKSFADCPYASFRGNDGKFDATLIPGGGNPNKPRSVLFSLPDSTNGDSFCGFYTSLKLSDGTLNTICPSAALVSNNFMMKYSTTHPYYIVAGPNYGLINTTGLVGPDYNFSQQELEALEPFGVNCMLFVPRIGTYINADQTAKQKIVSALSKVHVRELVIYLQDEIAKVLQKYHWEFNTQTVRDQIKARADSICENVKANGGLQAYLNIMDSSNNTPEIIDRQMAVLSTHIEPGMGMGIMVHELTIYRTGEMASSIQTNV